jgi:hypothetical protein
MANGVIKSISMSAFVEGALALELPHICVLFFPIPFFHFSKSCFIIYLQVPFVRFQAISIAFFWTGVSTERIELEFGPAFVGPLCYHSFLSFASFSYSFHSSCETTSRPSTPLLMREWTMTHYQSLVHYERIQD